MRKRFTILDLIWVYILFGVIGYQNVSAQSIPAGFATVTLSNQWNEAVGLTFTKDGSAMFVWERAGKVWVVINNQKQLILDISEEVGSFHDVGLLGFALHPLFEQNGYFYLLYVVDRHHLMNFGTGAYNPAANDFFKATISRLTRYTATKTAGSYSVDPSSRKILIGATRSTGIPQVSASHSIGSIVFGTDNTLLLSTGDAAAAAIDNGNYASGGSYHVDALNDGIITPTENVGTFRSQILDGYNGKLLRIDPETGEGIPSNPFYDPSRPNAPISKVYALGLRQPFRMSLKPGTGSHNPADGNPGILYIGDVGWNTWEELNVVTRPGMNFGWPIFEGFEQNPDLAPLLTPNRSAPNPLYQVNGCTQEYFNFQDLLKQETASGNVTFSNPCNPGEGLPPTVRGFMHSRPIIDWRHITSQSRTGIFNGETAAVVNIGAAGSPVSGPQFGGSCTGGGVFYPHDDFPPEYQNTFFFGDYSGNWIRTLNVDQADKPVQVRNFLNYGSYVVYMTTHPTEGGIYYISFPSEIRKIYTTNNLPPLAVAEVNNKYGASPLNAQFTGSNSSDPEGAQLSYEWNFGDGSPLSTAANPIHSFTAPPGVPTQYTVTLTVRDPQGASAQTTLAISVNNTPPEVTITSLVDGTLYPMNTESVYPLQATVTDLEHSANQLSYAWQTILHHDTHQHPEPFDNAPATSTTIEPVGCDGHIYFYRIVLTVTDPSGGSTTKEVKLYPDCGSVGKIIPTITWENPSPIMVGTPLGATQLNAGAIYNGSPVAGTFTYTPPAGTILELGEGQQLSVDFAPTNTTVYDAPPTRTVMIDVVEVTKVTPVITWANPAAITVGTALSATQLNATATYNGSPVAGVFTYTPPAGTVLGLGTGQVLSVNFAPANTTLYNAASKTVTIDVNDVPTSTFYRALNLNGPALVIDGNTFAASVGAPNFSYTTNEKTFVNQNVTLIPPTDANRATMIRSSIYGNTVTLNITSVPSGSYDVSFYVWEDNSTQTYSVSLEGVAILSNYVSGSAGTWRKHGPYPVNITDGAINVASSGGHANFSGIEIWTSGPPPANRPPVVANAISDQNASAGLAFNYTFPSNTFSDPDAGTILTYAAALENGNPLPGWLSFNGTSRNFSGTPALTDLGSVDVRVTASDGAGGMVSDIFLLTVAEVEKVTPLITWNNPSPITAGTALGATQLNATATYNGSPVAGVFTYTPPAGTMLALGAGQELSVNFAPTNTILYNPASKTVMIDVVEVTKVTPVITWANPAAITVGTALSATQLNATATHNGSPVAGVFTYTPPAGTVLGLGAGQELSVNFAPTNTTLYNAASKTVTIDVNDVPTSTFYRALNLNGPALVIDGNNWTASVGAPNFSYTTNEKTFVNQNVTLIPPTDANRATMIRSSIYGNTMTLNITAVPSGSYDVSFYVWEDNFTQTYSVSLEGVAILSNYVSGSAGTWRKHGPYPVNITDGAINLSSSGGHANFSGVEIWTSGPPPANRPPVVANAISDQNASAGLAFNYTFPSNTFSDPDAGTILTYTAALENGNPLPGWLSFNGTSRNFSGTPALTDLGSVDVRVTASDGAGGMVSDIFLLTVAEVEKVTPLITWNNPSPITAGTALGATQLNATATYNGSPVAGVFTYTPPAGTMLALGAGQELSVNFAPTNTILYNPASKTVMIDVVEVTKVTPVITWANPAAITVGTALSATQLNATATHNGSPVAGVFTYTPPAGTVLGLGTGQVLSVNFAPTNTTLYNAASKTVTIDVNDVPTSTFYRALNLNGPALVIDGNTFAASVGAPNFSYTTNEKTFVNQNVTLIPPTDANRATMIRSSIYGNTITLNITSVPSGSYDVSFYVWEDNFTQTYSVSLEGVVILSNYVSGSAGTWRKHGPYPVNITDGAINLSSSGGHANFSGIEIWTGTDASSLRSSSTARHASYVEETTNGSETLEAFPNPFSKVINVKYRAHQSGNARLELFDVRGRRVHVLYEGRMSEGESQEKELESSALPDGVYILQFVNGKHVSRLMLIGVQ